MTFLITRPRYDNPTHYLFFWAQQLVDDAKSRGLTVFDLSKKKARRKTVESYLVKRAPSLVIFNGHGTDSSVMGHNNEELILANRNEHLLEGKNIFVRACSAGKVLGPKAVQSGALGFIGYKEPYMFWTDADKFRSPLKDELARPFLESSNHIALSLIKGNSVKEAHEKSMKVYAKLIVEMLTSKSSNPYTLPELISNMRNQVYY